MVGIVRAKGFEVTNLFRQIVQSQRESPFLGGLVCFRESEAVTANFDVGRIDPVAFWHEICYALSHI